MTAPGEQPQRIVCVAAVAANGVIGAAGGIPWHLPEDFQHFKQLTLGSTLVMGRATFDSIGRSLPGRTTVVVTRDRGWHHDGVHLTHGVDEAIDLALTLPGEVMIAGGAQIYAAALPRATHQCLSEIPLEVAGDTHYPAFAAEEWHEVSRTPHEGFTVVWWERR